MASVVDTSVKHFQSTLANAPVLNGTAGSLIGLLDSVLVNGYGLQTATSVVVADGIATCTFPAAFPALVDQVILVAGATPTVLNGEQKIVSIGANIVRFATTAPNGTATGTITVKIAPAGWTKAFSGTNKAVYRSSDPQAHGGGMFLRVDDSNSTQTRVIGYETMTDVDTGVAPFPTGTTNNLGGYWIKSGSAGTTPASWFIAADSRFFIISTLPNTSGGANFRTCLTRGFGDLIPRRPSGDAFAVALNSGSSGTSSEYPLGCFDGGLATPATYLARPYIGLGSAEANFVAPFSASQTSGSIYSGLDATFGAFPSPISGELFISKVFVKPSGSSFPRANVPGIFYIPQNGVGTGISVFDRVVGSGEVAGRTMIALNPSSNVSNTSGFGCSLVDVTGPWR